MATKIVNSKTNKPEEKGTYLTKDNWEVMKPFVHFAFKAIAVIGGTLFTLVKLIPKALEDKPAYKKNDKVIKL